MSCPKSKRRSSTCSNLTRAHAHSRGAHAHPCGARARTHTHTCRARAHPITTTHARRYFFEQPRGSLLAPPESLSFFVRAAFVAAPALRRVADVLAAAMESAPCPHCYIHFQHAGGAVGDMPDNATCFAARGLEWSVVVSGCWPREQAVTLEALCMVWVRACIRSLLPHALATYSTDLGPEDAEFARYSYGGPGSALCEGLMRLKRTWDPRNMFSAGFPLVSAAASELQASPSRIKPRL